MGNGNVPGLHDESRGLNDGHPPGADENAEDRVARASSTHRGHGVGGDHGNHLTTEEAPPEALRKAWGLGVPAVLPMEETMTIPTTGKRSGKRPKAASKQKAQRSAPSRQEKKPGEPQVVFAFRLSEADRDRIHKAAGPGKATWFVRAAALAAATANSRAFDDVVAQTKLNRSK